jgi:hypothetical protein
MLRLLIICITLVSCSKHTPEKARVAKEPVELDSKIIQALELQNHYSTTDTFTFFFFPKAGTMNWDSEVFNKNDSDLEKLSDIIAEVVKMSDLIDASDLKSYELLQTNKQLEKELVSNSCVGESDDFGDDFELKSTHQFSSATNTCEVINQEIMDNAMEMARLSSSEKGKYLRGIQKAIDDVSFSKVDETTYEKQGTVVNWFPYGDQNSYVFKLFEKVTANGKSIQKFNPYIVLPTLGSPANKYDTESGDIYDVEYVNSQYAPATMMLKFKVKEKGVSGEYTGYIWDAELEKSNFAGKIRFSGDVIRRNSKGESVQQGIMKFELAENDFSNQDDFGNDDDFGDDFGDDFDF